METGQVPPPLPRPPPGPISIFVPQRGGPTSAAAAFRAATTSNISGIGAVASVGDCSNLFDANYPNLVRRFEASPFDPNLVNDIDRLISVLDRWSEPGPRGFYRPRLCDPFITRLQALRVQVLTARGVDPRGVGPLFGPGAYIAPTGEPQRGVAVVPTPFAPERPFTPEEYGRYGRFLTQEEADQLLGSTPGSIPGAALSEPPVLPIYVPQRGGPASAAAAFRAATTPTISGWRG